MKFLIHDLEKADYRKLFLLDPPDCQILSPARQVRACIGCENCWLKTPGICPIRDDLSTLTSNLSLTDEIIIISRCVYGGVSPFIKNVFDRMRGILTPNLEIREGDTQFRLRYPGRFRVKLFYYGAAEEEKKAAEEYASRLSRVYNMISIRVRFAEDMEDLKGMLL